MYLITSVYNECLSPSLFSSFINDLDEAMDDVESMGVTIHGTRITVLKYADDIFWIGRILLT